MNFIKNLKIHLICFRYNIRNYTIKGDLVNVEGDVYLCNNRLTELPLKFGEVTGYFKCSCNRLTSLKGSPTYVGGYFTCAFNELKSLEGSPRYVGGDFSCSDNRLTDLKGCPDEVEGEFYCHVNNIYSLDGLLFKRINVIFISDNPIYDLYKKYNLADIDHREFLIEADVIRPPKEIGGLPIINKDRMYWFTQTYGLEKFIGDENYKLQL